MTKTNRHDLCGTLRGSRAPRDGLRRGTRLRPHDDLCGTLRGSRAPRDGLRRGTRLRPHDRNLARAFVFAFALALPAGAFPGLARAQPAGASADAATGSGFHADFEIDPTAYVFQGHSLHVGLGWKKLRLDLGAFALALPDGLTGHDDFSVAFDGYGVKLQYFPFAEQRGAFVGVDAGVARPFVRRKGTDLAARRTEYSAGVNFGWRFVFFERFYATAWLGLSRPLGREPVTLAGSTYQGSAITIFPAVHLGYRFQ